MVWSTESSGSPQRGHLFVTCRPHWRILSLMGRCRVSHLGIHKRRNKGVFFKALAVSFHATHASGLGTVRRFPQYLNAAGCHMMDRISFRSKLGSRWSLCQRLHSLVTGRLKAGNWRSEAVCQNALATVSIRTFNCSHGSMVRSGLTANVAIDRVYEHYGRNNIVTTILNSMLRDRRNNTVPNL
jgi:hypothetical protein